MSEEAAIHEDQSHYEISLTAGQAFAAFVLLLLSLAASFAFGLVIGRQADERVAVRKEPAVINEATVVPRKGVPKTVELSNDDFKPVITETSVVATPPAGPLPAGGPAATPTVPAYAQLLSSSDQKAAEAMAARLIDCGFSSASV